MQVVCDTLCVTHNLLWRTVCHWYFPASLTSTAVSLQLLSTFERDKATWQCPGNSDKLQVSGRLKAFLWERGSISIKQLPIQSESLEWPGITCWSKAPTAMHYSCQWTCLFAAFQDNVMLCTAAGCQEKVDSWFTRDNDQIRGGSVKLEGGWFNWDRLGRGTFGAFIARRHHIVRWFPNPLAFGSDFLFQFRQRPCQSKAELWFNIKNQSKKSQTNNMNINFKEPCCRWWQGFFSTLWVIYCPLKVLNV